MNSTTICAPNGDINFDPQVEPCLRAFDFTVQFEDIFLSIAPSALFILIAPVRIYFLAKVPRRVVGGSTFQILKLVCNSSQCSAPVPLTDSIVSDCVIWTLAT